MNTTTDYTSRQIDVELLQSITKPAELVAVTVSNVTKPAKMVTGIQKLVQRYTLLLLTNLGDVKFDQEQGGDLLTSVLDGYVQDVGQLQYAFAAANSVVSTTLATEDLDVEAYGAPVDDESLALATLDDASLDRATGTAYLRILITTKAGTEFTFVVPVTGK